MKARQYNPEDHSVLSKWWQGHKWPPVPQEMLPEIGYVVEDFCAGFLYKTDSKICWMEFIISNPDSDKEKRNKALDVLINTIIDKARDEGFKTVFTSTNHPKLFSRLQDNKFILGDKDVIQMVRSL